MQLNDIGLNQENAASIFSSNAIFVIPRYQRGYAWGEKNWQQLFDDLTENDLGYFLGSLIYATSKNNGTDLHHLMIDVIDGQQRLTTLSILYAALYHCAKLHVDADDDDQQDIIRDLSKKLVWKNSKVREMRVRPQTQDSNLSDFRSLLSCEIGVLKEDAPAEPWAGIRRIYKCWKYFVKRIDAKIAEDTSVDPFDAICSIIDKVNSAILVTIKAPSQADAYVLFSSLNNTGIPLTPIDLMKNSLLSTSSNDDEADEMYNYWQNILRCLGDNGAIHERFFRQQYNAFRIELNGPFTDQPQALPLGGIATKTSMLRIYERIIRHDPMRFLNFSLTNAKIYQKLQTPKNGDFSSHLVEALFRLSKVEATPAYQLLLYLFREKEALAFSEHQLALIVEKLTAFFFRRNVTDVPPTRDLSRLFMAFTDKIIKEELRGSVLTDSLITLLREKTATDSIFTEALSGPIYYNNYGMTRFALYALSESGMNQEFHPDLWEQFDNSNHPYIWTVEHIFPEGKNIPEEWVDAIANGDAAKAAELQEEFVHKLGNLTFTAFNASLSNRPFLAKRDHMKNGVYTGYRNRLNLNDDLRDKEAWTVTDIQIRTDKMVKRLTELFRI